MRSHPPALDTFTEAALFGVQVHTSLPSKEVMVKCTWSTTKGARCARVEARLKMLALKSKDLPCVLCEPRSMAPKAQDGALFEGRRRCEAQGLEVQRARVVPHAWKIASIVRTLPHSRQGATLSCKCECPSATLLLLREPLWIDALPDMALMSQRGCVFGTIRPVKTTPAPISDRKKLGLRQFSPPRVAFKSQQLLHWVWVSIQEPVGCSLRDIKLKVPLGTKPRFASSKRLPRSPELALES